MSTVDSTPLPSSEITEKSKLGFSDSACEVPEEMYEIMRRNSEALEEATNKGRD